MALPKFFPRDPAPRSAEAKPQLANPRPCDATRSRAIVQTTQRNRRIGPTPCRLPLLLLATKRTTSRLKERRPCAMVCQKLLEWCAPYCAPDDVLRPCLRDSCSYANVRWDVEGSFARRAGPCRSSYICHSFSSSCACPHPIEPQILLYDCTDCLVPALFVLYSACSIIPIGGKGVRAFPKKTNKVASR